ncbi:DUF805 domain-containing protein [Brevundimonas naejangsanensis]|uniref:DUF805 domain-containing protein n=1 Tax=Brevundimonas naejangsanensis TaxID=588932 RepID=UPI000ED4E173|nr:DUF805 domain-containing protein [Brevundimonas naejangsanensis]HAC01392.1 hypothetical protein [Brevundimonas sp.]HCW50366.1 hypothetical protein [Brevundimonas sp.]
MTAIWDGFRRLLDFSGRDRRGRFWPYALVVVALAYVGMILAMMPAMAEMMVEAARQSAETHEQAAPLDSEWAPDLGAVFWPIRGVVAGAAVLLAAAVTRRLHDTGRAGWWAALPLVLLAAATATFPSVMEQMMTQAENAPMGLFYLTFGLGMLYNLSLLVLIVFLCLKGTVGPNRYGPQPN